MNDLKLIVFDLNKTLIKENSWLNLNIAMGMTDQEDQELMDKFENGLITYEEGQKILEDIYKKSGKATRKNIEKSIFRYTYLPYARELIAYLRPKYEIALISGSIDILVEKVAAELGIKYYGANNYFEFNKNDYLKEIRVDGEDTKIKTVQLLRFCESLSINPQSCSCVGDGDNDIEIFKLTGHGITFSGSKIESYSWKVVSSLQEVSTIL